MGLVVPPAPIGVLVDNNIEAITLRQAPLWQRLILQHFCIPDNELLISTLSNPDEKLYIVSDGGIKDCKGSFGVALVTSSVELLSIEGPVSGFQSILNLYEAKLMASWLLLIFYQ